jgi:hypothetical protein
MAGKRQKRKAGNEEEVIEDGSFDGRGLFLAPVCGVAENRLRDLR